MGALKNKSEFLNIKVENSNIKLEFLNIKLEFSGMNLCRKLCETAQNIVNETVRKTI